MRFTDRREAGRQLATRLAQSELDDPVVLALPRGVIHSVWNETAGVTLSLHIYGKHINHTGRSQFDLEKRTETPFIVKMQS